MRPKDIYGAEIIMGPWYWAKGQRGQIVGTGKFAATISRPDDISFFINGNAYDPLGWEFVLAEDPDGKFMPAPLAKHVADWLCGNEKTREQVRHGTFPLGMVQRWIERAQVAEQRLKTKDLAEAK